ncbi:hypothetical protein CONPUDRAFT_116969 [Coniophora puteana RWD-64-598 SS2]|uniref:Helicase C-terminal domain-containing protein n=1 Tax=Coniophora puteana (strain RWD-64-598) TaxID=741705 RepID=A0A5M3N1N9_CONPW|nr:uncharacterized protein CONPUDRAFT_116969 [Coniophora puteana RWD-64-598 SS2]EIW84791.1 hypothetical protein CONPUDRAFT_116969 [Coniophora puteana RWD-64-598 SS2]
MTEQLLLALAFLVEHYYVRATCCTTPSLNRFLFVRIYLIPHDLPNARGRLRNRDAVVAAQARGYLKILLAEVRQEPSCWDAVATTFKLKDPKMFVPRELDNRSMAEIYSDLPSPRVSSTNAADALSSVWGLRSSLYNYQRRSVAMMIEKEASHQVVPDPLYVKMPSMRGQDMFLQPTTMEVLRECPNIAPVRGGILCEELGTGKTVMVLALILATIEERPDPEDCDLYERPVMSPVACRTFRSPEYATSHCHAHGGPRSEEVWPVPSLVDILIHGLRTLPCAPGVREYEEELAARNLWKPLQSNIPFYHVHREAPSSRSRLRKVQSHPRVMYLSSATLVVVPSNLLRQWDREVLKHCTSDVKYKLLRIKDRMPSAQELASQYDVSLSGLRRESTRTNVESLFTAQPCTCPFIPGSRVPDCRCPGRPDASPLLQVRWKRLVIDEGHTSGNIEHTINRFIPTMSIERKWIVTGTPTANTLGLSLGRSVSDEASDSGDEWQAVGLLREPELSASPADQQPATESGIVMNVDDDNDTDADPEPASAPRRIWTVDDRANLRKLSVMIAKFLGVPRFKSDGKLFTRCVSSPLCAPQGPHPFAVQVLSQAMQMVMVRHRIEDVENEVGLPPMTHKTEYMDLDPYARKSYNAMLAAVAVNAVDSRRTDIDYLFHPKRLKELNTAVANMSQGLFWSASDILYNVDQISFDGEELLDRARGRGVPQADIDLLEQSIRHAHAAANDKLWRAMQVHEDVPFRVSHLDPPIFAAWNRGKLGTTHGAEDLPLRVMHANRLVQLRELVRRRPLITHGALVDEGLGVRALEAARCEKKAASVQAVEKEDLMRRMVSEVDQEMEVLMKRADEEEEGVAEPGTVMSTALASPCAPTALALSPLLASSPMRQTRVGGSLSTKLNFILQEVLEHHRDEKFLIFSSSPLTLAHVAEGLSLIEVKFLRYTTEIMRDKRDDFVMTFETSDTFRVFLMELKHAARGLNLISASRIIFCEPVWQPDVESQAIKRAHRMGQTRPIVVKTLAIRSTAEQEMMDRRQHLRGATNKIPPLTSDAGMRRFLESPTFLSESSGEEHALDLPFLGDFDSSPRVEDEDNASRSAMDVEETLSEDRPMDVTVVDQDRPAVIDKPRKVDTRFAEDVVGSTNGSSPQVKPQKISVSFAEDTDGPANEPSPQTKPHKVGVRFAEAVNGFANEPLPRKAKPRGAIVRFADDVDESAPVVKTTEAPEPLEQNAGVKFVAGFDREQAEASRSRREKPWKVKGVRFA